jgi:hypothetical protein
MQSFGYGLRRMQAHTPEQHAFDALPAIVSAARVGMVRSHQEQLPKQLGDEHGFDAV